MRRILALAIAGAVVWLFMTGRVTMGMFDPRPVGTDFDGREITRRVDDVEARFSRLRSYENTLVLFGAVTLPLRNAVQHAQLSGMPIRDARQLARHDDTFHLVGGADRQEAWDRVERFDFLAADRISRAMLDGARADFKNAVRAGGERPCLFVRGAELGLEAVEIPGVSADEALGAYAGSRFVLVEEARVEPCGPLLAPATTVATR